MHTDHALRLAGYVTMLFFQLEEFLLFIFIFILSFHCFKGWFSYLSMSSWVVLCQLHLYL